jgi:hypothetical protein
MSYVETGKLGDAIADAVDEFDETRHPGVPGEKRLENFRTQLRDKVIGKHGLPDTVARKIENILSSAGESAIYELITESKYDEARQKIFDSTAIPASEKENLQRCIDYLDIARELNIDTKGAWK